MEAERAADIDDTSAAALWGEFDMFWGGFALCCCVVGRCEDGLDGDYSGGDGAMAFVVRIKIERATWRFARRRGARGACAVQALSENSHTYITEHGK